MKSATKAQGKKTTTANGRHRNGILSINNGDRMSQTQFHRRYEDYPTDRKIELIGGMVFMASPTRFDHGQYGNEIGLVLGHYKSLTPGVRAASDVTVILGDTDEPEPDYLLLIDHDNGGRCTINRNGYCVGAPELVVEIAYSSIAIDFHVKKDCYRQAGVNEYLIYDIERGDLHWFDFANDGAITGDRLGVFRSRVFPGLWIDEGALNRQDTAALRQALELGTATAEHAAFVKKLQKARRKK